MRETVIKKILARNDEGEDGNKKITSEEEFEGEEGLESDEEELEEPAGEEEEFS